MKRPVKRSKSEPNRGSDSVERLVGHPCDSHNFVEEHCGWRCSKCGQFYPNTAPLESWLLGEPFSKEDCPHLDHKETETHIECRYCGEVLLP